MQLLPYLARQRLSAALAVSFIALLPASSQTVDQRGLWVGEVLVSFVNEVSVPLDANNVPIAPDPNVPTPTSDRANLRLILHVNGAGQVSLLKDVAILNRVSVANPYIGVPVNIGSHSNALQWQASGLSSESDLCLVSNEKLYGEFPPQPAIRIASAVFDFGDSRATEALDAVVTAIVNAVTNPVAASTEDLDTVAGRQITEQAATQAALAVAGPIVQQADVAASFDAFVRSSDMNSAAVDVIAAAANPANAAQTARGVALQLQNASFYGDSRGVEMIDAMLAAIAGAGSDTELAQQAAQNAAASFADTANDYQRFIAGKLFGDMVVAAAEAAAQVAIDPDATEEAIRAAVNDDPVVNDARAEALRLQVPLYRDTRASDAIQDVLEGVIAEAIGFLGEPDLVLAAVKDAVTAAGRTTLSSAVRRYAVPVQTPTLDYNEFIRSSPFQNSATVAAAAAAQAAISERRNNPLYTADSLGGAARVAAMEALRSAYSAAARAARTELPLMGTFGPGQGDARLTWNIKQNNEPPLGAAALSGTIHLPANHPTNPFRHRRHPDHTVGFDILRHLRLDFDASPTNTIERAGFGVDRIAGTYREEILGLHKPLGPDRNVGLKVEGRFELQRISLIDTLNAR